MQRVQHLVDQPAGRAGVAVEMPAMAITTMAHTLFHSPHQLVQMMDRLVQFPQVPLQMDQVTARMGHLVHVGRPALDPPRVGQQVAKTVHVTITALQFDHQTIGLPL